MTETSGSFMLKGSPVAGNWNIKINSSKGDLPVSATVIQIPVKVD